jgi:hypothetical protein
MDARHVSVLRDALGTAGPIVEANRMNVGVLIRISMRARLHPVDRRGGSTKVDTTPFDADEVAATAGRAAAPGRCRR